MPPSPSRARHRALAFAASLAVAPLPAWAAGSVATLAAYGLFLVAAIAVIALLLREALFDTDDEHQHRSEASLGGPKARYDDQDAASQTATNRRVP